MFLVKEKQHESSSNEESNKRNAVDFRQGGEISPKTQKALEKQIENSPKTQKAIEKQTESSPKTQKAVEKQIESSPKTTKKTKKPLPIPSPRSSDSPTNNKKKEESQNSISE